MASDVQSVRPLKRPLEDIDELSPAKRLRQPYHRRHVIRNKPQVISSREQAQVTSEVVDKLLFDSIKHICEEQGVKQDIYSPIIESVALESFRNATEEFILKLCSTIRCSMVAARRTAPIAPDFETALKILNVPVPLDQLHPYDTTPQINPPLLPTPPPEDPFHDLLKYPKSFLGPALADQSKLKKFSFTPSSLPSLPSAHTYRDTPVFSERETDSRKIRELATEEGKLGEQALRKLAGAVKLDAAHPMESSTKEQILPKIKPPRRRRKVGVSEEAVFEATMQELLKNEPDGFELGPIVTAEKAYRMPDDGQTKRRPGMSEKQKE